MIEIKQYDSNWKDKWDDFVLHKSFNGTFLQSKAFLDYHGDRFQDGSLLFVNSGNIIGVCPAALVEENGQTAFISHPGSTFGGFVIGREYNTISNDSEIVDVFSQYVKDKGFSRVLLKIPSDIFSSDTNALMEYLLFKNGFQSYQELSFAMPFSGPEEDVVANFKSKTRNLYNNSLKRNLEFREFSDNDNISSFYSILCESLLKYDTKPVHTLDQIMDLYHNRIGNYMRFFGVFLDNKMIAGSMVFLLNTAFHTQYLAADPAFLNDKPMDFLDANLIQFACRNGYRYFSFGISTEDHGRTLNETLAKYKEGFGTKCYNNRSYFLSLK